MFNLDLRYIILPPGPLPPLPELHQRATPCRSFVFNFLSLFWVNFKQVARTITDNLGVNRTIIAHLWDTFSNAIATQSDFGIQVGTGPTPPEPEDYRLASLIIHGVGAGQLSYGAVAYIDPYIVTGVTYAAISRVLTNNTASPIIVYEIGLSIIGWDGAARRILVARDVILEGTTIAAGASKQFIYTMATET